MIRRSCAPYVRKATRFHGEWNYRSDGARPVWSGGLSRRALPRSVQYLCLAICFLSDRKVKDCKPGGQQTPGYNAQR